LITPHSFHPHGKYYYRNFEWDEIHRLEIRIVKWGEWPKEWAKIGRLKNLGYAIRLIFPIRQEYLIKAYFHEESCTWQLVPPISTNSRLFLHGKQSSSSTCVTSAPYNGKVFNSGSNSKSVTLSMSQKPFSSRCTFELCYTIV
jgi:hypothetical protein